MDARLHSILRRGREGRRAFSLTEILVVLAIIGILSAIAIPMITGVRERSRVETARAVVAQINRAVAAYGQTGVMITASGPAGAPTTIAAIEAEVSDERAVMALLTTRDEGVVGSPFLPGTGMPAEASSDAARFRARWNGQYFEVVPAGEAGWGLLIPL